MAYPIILLVALLALLGSGFGGYRYGKHVCQGEQATTVAAAQNEAIARANLDVEAATKRAVEQAKVEAAQRLAATTIRLKGERDAALKARTECSRDADSERLLRESIAAANGQSTDTNTLSDPLRSTPSADQR